MNKSELKKLIKECLKESAYDVGGEDENINDAVKETPDYKTQLQIAFRKAKKEKNIEAMTYYYELLNSNTSASVSFEKFKGSWAYEQWLKKPQTQRIIDDIKKRI